MCVSKSGRRGGSLPAFVVRWHARPFAYINECQHQATELDWNAGDFFDESKLYLMCATHWRAVRAGQRILRLGPMPWGASRACRSPRA